MTYRVLTGDCRETLKTLPDKSVHCVVTSPPYWGLRSYLPEESAQKSQELGSEETPDEYVGNLISVFREIYRVLRDEGVLWLNLGDSFAGSGAVARVGATKQTNVGSRGSWGGGKDSTQRRHHPPSGLKEKDLVGIPWMVALALRADGWYLRQDVIWSKSNPMPESVTDRCTRSHEYLFMLTKQPRYFYDATAIREVSTGQTGAAAGFVRKSGTRNELLLPGQGASQHRDDRDDPTDTGTRNKRSVWSINPRPYREAHFAVMPPALVEPCLLAGTSEAGCCPTCGSPWERITEREKIPDRPNRVQERVGDSIDLAHGADHRGGNRHSLMVGTLGWAPTCACQSHTPVPCVILDPFGGSGTVGMVARWHGRDSILCELNPEYSKLIEERVWCERSDNGGWVEPKEDPEVSLDLLEALR